MKLLNFAELLNSQRSGVPPPPSDRSLSSSGAPPPSPWLIYGCPHCPRHLPTPAGLDAHVDAFHRPVQCRKCSKHFAGSYFLERHPCHPRARPSTATPTSSSGCAIPRWLLRKRLSDKRRKQALAREKKKVAATAKRKEQEARARSQGGGKGPSSVAVTYPCSHCPKVLHRKETLLSHVRSFHTLFSCVHCDEKVKGVSQQRHLNKFHQDVAYAVDQGRGSGNGHGHGHGRSHNDGKRRKVGVDGIQDSIIACEQNYKPCCQCDICNEQVLSTDIFRHYRFQHEQFTCRECNLQLEGEENLVGHKCAENDRLTDECVQEEDDDRDESWLAGYYHDVPAVEAIPAANLSSGFKSHRNPPSSPDPFLSVANGDGLDVNNNHHATPVFDPFDQAECRPFLDELFPDLNNNDADVNNDVGTSLASQRLYLWDDAFLNSARSKEDAGVFGSVGSSTSSLSTISDEGVFGSGEREETRPSDFANEVMELWPNGMTTTVAAEEEVATDSGSSSDLLKPVFFPYDDVIPKCQICDQTFFLLLDAELHCCPLRSAGAGATSGKNVPVLALPIHKSLANWELMGNLGF